MLSSPASQFLKFGFTESATNQYFSMTTSFSKKVRELNKKSRITVTDSKYFSIEAVDDRIICLMRLLLAVSALTITFIEPASSDRLVGITHTLLIGYCLYSAVFHFLARRGSFPVSIDLIPWIDMVWYLVLIAITNGTNSIFFFFFFFSILVAAFRSGFGAGVRITIVSAFLFSIIGYATAPPEQEFELNRFLIRPIYLIMLGYMVSYWGGQEIKFKRHLMLLKDVNRLSNPRFGIDRTLSDILNRLREFYEAESCMLITFDSSGTTYNWRESSHDNPVDNLKIEQTKAAAPLVKLPGELAIFYQNNTGFWYRKTKSRVYNVSTGNEVEIAPNICIALADLLAAESFLTVPVIEREEMVGRLYLISRQNSFGRSEVEFISQLINQVMTVVENVALLDHLASSAADRQWQKISHDLHDSTIQPYIALKLGLEALELNCAAGKVIEKDIEKLIKLTDSTIAELRGYVTGFKDKTGEAKGNILLPSVKQQVIKFQEFYGIKVTVEAPDDFQLNDRLAAEAFQIVSEGLSNIKRHTKAKQAAIRIYLGAERLFLEIENDNPKTDAILDFVPKSIVERAKSLGGTARVENLDSQTKVFVEIPL